VGRAEIKLRIKRGGDRGQTLIVIMLAMPLFLALMSLVVDGGNILVHKRNVQVAADAAALAVAQSVDLVANNCSQSCSDQGSAYARKNGVNVDSTWHKCNDVDPAHPTDTNCWAYPYVDKGGVAHNDQVEVRLRAHVTTFIAGVIGLYGANVSARAVALAKPELHVTPGSSTTVIVPGSATTVITPGSVSTSTIGTGGQGGGVAFAKSTACRGSPGGAAISYTGAGGGYIGALETNGGIDIGGNNNKTIDYLSLGRYGESVGGQPCYSNRSNPPATINHPITGPFAPKPWPIEPPPIPTPPTGCTFLNPVINITTRARNNAGSATLTTSQAHNLAVGDSVVVAGVQDASFNGTFIIAAVGSQTTFSYANPGPTVAPTSSAGTVTETSASVSISSSWPGPAHPPGIYCLTGIGTLNLSNVDLTGGDGYTFFAPYITVSGGAYKCYQLCSPLPDGFPSPGQIPTLFYAFGSDATKGITVQGSGATLTGYLFAPNGEIAFQGGSVSGGKGFLEAQTLKFAGNFASYQGIGPTGVTYTTTTSTGPGSTTVIVTPGSTDIQTIPATTSTSATTLALDE
jgi:Flp pilus assembly protein TadG